MIEVYDVYYTDTTKAKSTTALKQLSLIWWVFQARWLVWYNRITCIR